MWDFLDRARDIFATGTMSQEWAEHFNRVFVAISELQVVHSKSRLDIRNLESVFTTFEMAKNIGRLGSLKAEDVEKCVQSLQAVIFYTLDQCVLFPTADVTSEIVAPPVYRRFAECISASIGHSTTVITFNYDVALDVALAKSDLEISYGFEDPGTSFGRVVKLLKLHGSINWGLTAEQSKRKIVFCPPSELTANLRPSRPTSAVSLNLTNRLKQLIRADIEDLPLLVPPGLYKADYQGSLTDVWKSAAHALNRADEIFVFGYSLPETDFFFQNLYALGTVGDKVLRKFCVFDPNPEIEGRFRKLLGPGAESVFKFDDKKFDEGAGIEKGQASGDFFGSLVGPMFFSSATTHRKSPRL